MKTVNVTTTIGKGPKKGRRITLPVAFPTTMEEAVDLSGGDVILRLYLDASIIKFRAGVHSQLNNSVTDTQIKAAHNEAWSPKLGRSKMSGAQRLYNDFNKADPQDKFTALVGMLMKSGFNQEEAEKLAKGKPATEEATEKPVEKGKN